MSRTSQRALGSDSPAEATDPPGSHGPSAWGSPAFRRYWTGQAVSSIGDRLTPVALAFAVLEATGSPAQLGLVLAAVSAPYVLVLLVGGVWADRLDTRRVMLAADLARCVAQAGSGLLLVTGQASLGTLMAFQALYGSAQAFFDPASAAMVPATVPPGALQSANALMGIQRNAALVVGPAIAGVVVVAVGGGWGLVLDAATFAGNAVALSGLPGGSGGRGSRTTFLRELREGWQIFAGHGWLWGSVAHFSAFVGFVLGPLQILGPVQARDRLGGAAVWAVIAASQGVGAVLGGLLALRVRLPRPLAAGFAGLLLTWPGLLVALAAAAPTVVIAACALSAGAALALFAAVWATALQCHVPRSALSRVSAYDWLGSKAVQPIGLAFTGPLAATAGASDGLLGMGAWCVASTLVVLAVPAVRRLRSS